MKNTLCKWTPFVAGLLFFSTNTLFAQKNAKEWAFENYQKYSKEAQSCSNLVKEKDIEKFRQEFKKKGYRREKYVLGKTTWQDALVQLNKDGYFNDYIQQEKEYFPEDGSNSKTIKRDAASKHESEIWYRLGKIANAYATGELSFDKAYTEGFLKAILHYGNIEINRSNYVSRFHESCFAIPTTAMNIYYSFLDRMDAVEKGDLHTTLEADACVMLKTLALQAWTQPIRKDETDKDVSSVARFQHHVWWVGGNGLAYRSLLPVACMIKSIPMIDVLAEVAQGGISCTSQVTNETSFWSEGFTADGAGWGHGRQCLIWGYPIDGTSAALKTLSSLNGSAWEKKLNATNKAALLNYVRGSNWYFYKGYNLPCLGRGSFNYEKKREEIKSNMLVKVLRHDWMDSFTASEQKELNEFYEQAVANKISMEDQPLNYYNGCRWFFNNDDLIKKNKDYYVMVNMASVRCDGIESAPDMADAYNFTQCDGLTLYQRHGNEYKTIYGAFDVLKAPGVTARIGMDQLKPITNWRGYCSKYNFAGGATSEGRNGVAGYIFEKMNASSKENVNDKAGLEFDNPILYGVKAYKGYFFLGDYMIHLGAGVTNLKPEIKGDIQTSIEQTLRNNEVYLLVNGKEKSIGSGVQELSSTSKNMNWIVQKNQFAYSVLPQYTSKMNYICEQRKQDWVKMNISNKKQQDLSKTADVLQIWIDHGNQPVNDTYGYVVYLGKEKPAVALPYEVLHNDTTIQAVASKARDFVEAVFYQANQSLKIDSKMTVSTSEPAVLILERKGKEILCTINDPQMQPNLKNIVLTVNGENYPIPMPQGELTGKPTTYTIKTK